MGCNRIECKPGQETKLLKQKNKWGVTQDLDFFIWLRCSTCGTELSTNNENVPMAWLSKCSNQRDAVRACNIASPQSSIHVFIDYSHDIKVELDFSAQMITTLKQNPPKKTINQKLWWIKFMRRNGIPCVCVCVAMGKRWGGRVIFDAYWITHAVVSISVISDRERERSNVFWI